MEAALILRFLLIKEKERKEKKHRRKAMLFYPKGSKPQKQIIPLCVS